MTATSARTRRARSDARAVAVVQALVGTATVALVGVLAAAVLGAPAGLVAGALTAVDAAQLAVVGVGIGIAVAWYASRWLAPLLFDVSPRDAVVYATASLTLLAVAMLGSWVPARRASRTDPNVALRSE